MAALSDVRFSPPLYVAAVAALLETPLLRDAGTLLHYHRHQRRRSNAHPLLDGASGQRHNAGYLHRNAVSVSTLHKQSHR